MSDSDPEVTCRRSHVDFPWLDSAAVGVGAMTRSDVPTHLCIRTRTVGAAGRLYYHRA